MDSRVRHVISLMEDHLSKRLMLNSIARSVNLTPEHLCRIFKAETGDTPINYLRWLRIQKAKQLLDTSFLSVKEIMHIVGAGDESHFRRDFKTACGMTPSRYRAQLRMVVNETRVSYPTSKSAT